jgi:hypothetical protein
MPAKDEILGALEKELKAVNFVGARAELDRINWKIPSDDDLQSLRIASIAAEVADYFGDYDKARGILEKFGPDCVKTISDLHRRTQKQAGGENERLLMKQKVWVVVHWGLTFYRADRQALAQELFEMCKDVVTNHLVDGQDPCFGTLARISYVIALVHRQSYSYVAAKAKFTESIDFAWRHLEEKRNASDEAFAGTNSIAAFHVSKCLALGLGWICYEEGLPYLARPFIAAARVLLTGMNDTIIKSYIDLVYAASVRAALGDTKEHFSEAEEILIRTRGEFQKLKHKGYQMRAASEMAILYLQGADLAKADKHIREVKTLASPPATTTPVDHRWSCNAYILESRLWRLRSEIETQNAVAIRNEQREKDFQRKSAVSSEPDPRIKQCEGLAKELAARSLEAANHAMREAGELDAQAATFSFIDALIARGEAFLLLGRSGEANDSFLRALHHGGANEKVRAVTELHLARVCIRQRDKSRAEHHFAQWQLISEKVENAWIRRFSALVEREIKELKDFAIPWNAQVIDRESAVAEFHRFLAEWAVKKRGSIEAAAEELQLASGTVRNWLEEPKILEDKRKKDAQNNS